MTFVNFRTGQCAACFGNFHAECKGEECACICRARIDAEPVPESRVLELIEVSEQYPNVKNYLPPGAAYRDVALLLRELLERRKDAATGN